MKLDVWLQLWNQNSFFRTLLGSSLGNFWSVPAHLIYIQLQSLHRVGLSLWWVSKKMWALAPIFEHQLREGMERSVSILAVLKQAILSYNLVPMLGEKSWKTSYLWNTNIFKWVQWRVVFSLSVMFWELNCMEGKSVVAFF